MKYFSAAFGFLLLTAVGQGQINLTRTNCPYPLAPNQIIVVQSVESYGGIVSAVLACYLLDSNGFTIDNTTSPPTLRLIGGSGGSGINFADSEVPSGLINGSNITFTTAHTPISGSTHLFRNGIRMLPTIDYTISGTSISFVNGQTPQSGDILTVDYRY